jgi:hypothetical protein
MSTHSCAGLFSLSDRQLEALKAAAATLRVGERDGFMRNVATELGGYEPPVTDEQLTAAIASAIGIVPVKTHVFLCDGAEKTNKQERQHEKG